MNIENISKIIGFFNKNNITFLISIISFILSLWNFFKSLWANRSKLNMVCKSCTTARTSKRNLAYFEFSFENCSRLPISISRIFLCTNQTTIEFSWIPEKILTTEYCVNREVYEKRSYFSEKIPHTIEGLGVWGGYFYLESVNHMDTDTFINGCNYIILHTNRGIKRFRLIIDPNAINAKKSF